MANEVVQERLYNRADIVNFIGLTASATEFKKMTGFTDNGRTLNPETYERRYVDEKTQRKDVTGYATEIAYTLDRYVNNEVHDTIAEIHDLELTGVSLPIVTVNLNEKGAVANSFKAKKRMYSIIPDGDGDGTDAYQYTGVFGVNGEIVTGTATSVDGWKTCTFTADTDTPSPSAE
ncbi:MAG: hypothetical protein RR500_03975 [Bacilli bacterium]